MEVFFELELNGFPLDITFPSSSDITIKKLREFIKVGAHEVCFSLFFFLFFFKTKILK